jgi:hypothetical protein
MNTKTIIASATVLAVSGILASLIVSRPWVALRHVEPLKVTGYAELPVQSDIGIMEATITTTGASLPEAYQNAKEQLETLKSEISRASLKDSSIQELASYVEEVVRLTPEGNRTNVIDYYAVKRTLKMESTEVQKMETLARAIYDLSATGMRVSLSGPRYLISDLGDSKLELVRLATQNGRDRARVIAKNAKARIGKLVSARQGVIQITAPNSTDSSDWGTYDTSTIEKTAKVTVHLEWEIR